MSGENRNHDILPPVSEVAKDLQVQAKKFKIKFNSLKLQRTTSTVECSICLNCITTKEQILKLKCLHMFHYDCLLNWLKSTSNVECECPLCKQKIEFIKT